MTTLTLEALADRYATLKVQKDAIDAQMDAVKQELLIQMKPGQAIDTAEYKVSKNPGRSSIVWICDKDEQKALQNHLIEKGKMEAKVGEPYVSVRFKKIADYE